MGSSPLASPKSYEGQWGANSIGQIQGHGESIRLIKVVVVMSAGTSGIRIPKKSNQTVQISLQMLSSLINFSNFDFLPYRSKATGYSLNHPNTSHLRYRIRHRLNPQAFSTIPSQPKTENIRNINQTKTAPDSVRIHNLLRILFTSKTLRSLCRC